MRQSIQKSLYVFIIWATVLFCLYVRYHQIFFGVDFTDEGLAVAMPYRFILGDVPFVDEYGANQMGTWLLYPFFKIFHVLTGKPEGIVLFSRHLYIAFQLVLGWVVYTWAKQFLDRSLSHLVAVFALLFIPHNIPSLGYNSLGVGFFTMGCLLAVHLTQVSWSQKWILFGVGVLHALSILSYPTLIVAVFSFFPFLIFVFKNQGRIKTRWYLAGNVLVGTLTLSFLFYIGIDNFISGIRLHMSTGMQGGGSNKFAEILEAYTAGFTYKAWCLAGLVAAMVLYRFVSKRFALLLIGLPILPLFSSYHLSSIGVRDSIWFMSYFGIAAPLLLLFYPQRHRFRSSFLLVWVPSFIAGWIYSWTSNSGGSRFGIGFFPAAIVTATIAATIIQDSNSKYGKRVPIGASVALALACLIMANFLNPLVSFADVPASEIHTSYRDESPSRLTTKIESGAYWAIYTSKEKAAFLNQLSEDFLSIIRPKDRVFFYIRFPAGYILSSLRPNTYALWVLNYGALDRAPLMDYYERSGQYPDVAVKIEREREFKGDQDFDIGQSADDPLNQLFESDRYERVISRKTHSIFRKK